MAKITAIDTERSRESLKYFKTYFELFDFYESDWINCNKKLNEAFNNFKLYLLDLELAKMEIYEINNEKQRINTNALIQYGIKNIYDLSKFSDNEIIQIRGISSISLSKIKNSLSSIKETTLESLNIKINPKDRNPESDLLIEVLYVLIYNRENNIYLTQAKDISYTNYFNVFKEARKIQNKLFWIFRNNLSRNNINSAVQTLQVLQKEENFNRALEKLNNYVLSKEDLKNKSWQHFLKNSINYYTFLESKFDISHSNEEDTITIEELERFKASVSNKGQFDLNSSAFDQSLNEKPKDFTGKKFHYLTKAKITEIENTFVNLKFFKSQLRIYQLFAVKFSILTKKVLIGDEMGLGKTIEAIAALCHFKTIGFKKFLVIVP